MLVGRFSLGVTGDAGKDGIVGRVGVAVGAGVPFTLVLTGIDREILVVVVKGRGCPGILGMAHFAIRRELCGCMWRIVGLVIIRLVTAITGVWRVVVIAVVTIGTLVCNGHMRSLQHIIVVVDWEGGRLPIGIGGMALLAVIRNANGNVIGV